MKVNLLFFLFFILTVSFAMAQRPVTKFRDEPSGGTNWNGPAKEGPSYKPKGNQTDWNGPKRYSSPFKGKNGTDWNGEPKYVPVFKKPFERYSTVGIGVGTSNYYGELTSYRAPLQSILAMTRWNVSGDYSRFFTSRFGARFNISVARIIGDDDVFKDNELLESKYIRGLHFRNTLKEMSLQGMFNLKSFHNGTYAKRANFVPFLFAGIAVVNTNPLAKGPVNEPSNNTWNRLRDVTLEDTGGELSYTTSSIAYALPFGLGFKFKLNDNFDFSAEGGFRYTFGAGGRYLDGVSGYYVIDSDEPSNDTDVKRFGYRADETVAARTGKPRSVVAAQLPATQDTFGNPTQRGNGRQDIYFLSVFKLNYYFPGPQRCLPIRY